MARLLTFALLAVQWLLLVSFVSGDAVGDLLKKGRPSLDALVAKSKTCTKERLEIRREWYVCFLSDSQLSMSFVGLNMW